MRALAHTHYTVCAPRLDAGSMRVCLRPPVSHCPHRSAGFLCRPPAPPPPTRKYIPIVFFASFRLRPRASSVSRVSVSGILVGGTSDKHASLHPAPSSHPPTSMCLLSVKEEEPPIPARVVRTRRVVRRSPSPPREVRITRQSYVEERRPSPPSPPRPEPEPQVSATTIRTEQRTEQRHVSRPPSVAPPVSIAPSRSAPTHFVEVEQDSSSSEEDVRSRTTRKSSRSKASKPRTEAPASEYSIHEREYRRERGYSNPPPKPEYETYRYVEAPRNRSGSKSGYHEGSRVSRDSFRREDDYGRRYHR
jgi:hypothetical protein